MGREACNTCHKLTRVHATFSKRSIIRQIIEAIDERKCQHLPRVTFWVPFWTASGANKRTMCSFCTCWLLLSLASNPSIFDCRDWPFALRCPTWGVSSAVPNAFPSADFVKSSVAPLDSDWSGSSKILSAVCRLLKSRWLEFKSFILNG